MFDTEPLSFGFTNSHEWREVAERAEKRRLCGELARRMRNDYGIDLPDEAAVLLVETWEEISCGS